MINSLIYPKLSRLVDSDEFPKFLWKSVMLSVGMAVLLSPGIFFGGMDIKFIIPRKIRGFDWSVSDLISKLYAAVGIFSIRNRLICVRSTEDARVFGVIKTYMWGSISKFTNTRIWSNRSGFFLFLGTDCLLVDVNRVFSCIF